METDSCEAPKRPGKESLDNNSVSVVPCSPKAEPSTSVASKALVTSGPSARWKENHSAFNSRSRSPSSTPPSCPPACQTTLTVSLAAEICSAFALV